MAVAFHDFATKKNSTVFRLRGNISELQPDLLNFAGRQIHPVSEDRPERDQPDIGRKLPVGQASRPVPAPISLWHLDRQ